MMGFVRGISGFKYGIIFWVSEYEKIQGANHLLKCKKKVQIIYSPED